MILWGECQDLVQEHVALGPRTTWGIGGRARFFAAPRTTEQLAALLGTAYRRGIPTYALGGGSNVLIGDGTLEGLVVTFTGADALAGIHVDPDAQQIVAGGGATLAGVLHHAARAGLSGLEGLAGIPGSVGGAVRMNAGSAAWGIGACVREVKGVDYHGNAHTHAASDLSFGYRKSNLAGIVVTEVTLQLTADSADTIQERMRTRLAEKKAGQPLHGKSAGCVFRNPESASAGQLLDRVGLKGYTIGGATVSERHANFFLNTGAASAMDMLRLIEYAREMVLRESGIELTREVQVWI